MRSVRVRGPGVWCLDIPDRCVRAYDYIKSKRRKNLGKKRHDLSCDRSRDRWSLIGTVSYISAVYVRFTTRSPSHDLSEARSQPTC